MNLPLFLALAVPVSCLAFLSSLALLGVMTLGGVIHLLGTVGHAGGNSLSGKASSGPSVSLQRIRAFVPCGLKNRCIPTSRVLARMRSAGMFAIAPLSDDQQKWPGHCMTVAISPSLLGVPPSVIASSRCGDFQSTRMDR